MNDIERLAQKYTSEYYAEEHLTDAIRHEDFDQKVLTIAERMERDGHPESDIAEVSNHLLEVGEGRWCLDPRMVKAFHHLRDGEDMAAYEIFARTPAFLMSFAQFTQNQAIVLLRSILQGNPVKDVDRRDIHGTFSLSTDDLIVDTLKQSGRSQELIDLYNTHGLSMKCI